MDSINKIVYNLGVFFTLIIYGNVYHQKLLYLQDVALRNLRLGVYGAFGAAQSMSALFINY